MKPITRPWSASGTASVEPTLAPLEPGLLGGPVARRAPPTEGRSPPRGAAWRRGRGSPLSATAGSCWPQRPGCRRRPLVGVHHVAGVGVVTARPRPGRRRPGRPSPTAPARRPSSRCVGRQVHEGRGQPHQPSLVDQRLRSCCSTSVWASTRRRVTRTPPTGPRRARLTASTLIGTHSPAATRTRTGGPGRCPRRPPHASMQPERPLEVVGVEELGQACPTTISRVVAGERRPGRGWRR